MKIILTPLLFDLFRSSISSAFVEASNDSKAAKLAKAKFPKANVHDRLNPKSMSMCMSVDYDDDVADPGTDDLGTPGGGGGPSSDCGGFFFNSYRLSNDVICEELAGDTAGKCAITMFGPDTEIDCRDFKVSQVLPQPGAAQNCKVDPFDRFPQDPVDRVKMKQECGLSYAYGICLAGGAKAKNCHVDSFAAGIYVFSAALPSEVTNTTVEENQYGVLANNDMIISNSQARFNGAAGFSAFNDDASSTLDVTISRITADNNGRIDGPTDNPDEFASSASGIWIDSKGKCSVDFDLVSTLENENGIGMSCDGGGDIKMKDVLSVGNDDTGILIYAKDDTTIDLEGSIEDGTSGVLNGVTSSRNGAGGLIIIKELAPNPVVFKSIKLNVLGNVVLERNGQRIPYAPGFLSTIDYLSTLNVVVDTEGSFTSCDNAQLDVIMDPKGGFTWVGDKTCDTTKTLVSGDFTCSLPCPP